MRTGLSLTATLLASVVAVGSPAVAQDLGRQGTLTFSQGLEFSDNVGLTTPAESGFTATTGVDLALRFETRTQVLSFGIGTDLVGEFGDGLRDDFEFERSRASLLYTREGANTLLRFSAAYTETQLDDDVFDLGDGSSLIIDQGSVNSTDVRLGLTFGAGGPVETILNTRFRDLDYQDTVDPDLVDEETTSADVLSRFRLNPALTLRARAGLSVTDEDDAVSTEREESFAGLGIETETGGGLSIVGDVLYDSTKTTDTSPSSTRDDGVGLELGLTQERPNGAISVDLSSRIDEAGRRSSAEVSRDFDLPAGAIGFSLGVVDQEGDASLQVIGGLDYTRELPRGGITASLRQDASSRDGEAFLDTSLSLVFTQEINAVSGWQAGLSYSASEELGGVDDDNRATATFTYTRELAEDWSMNTGLEHVRVNEDGAPDRTSNSVFFNIQRDITFGF